MSPLRRMPLRQSLNRTATLLGVERVPVALLILITALLVFSGMTLVTGLLGVLIFGLGLYCLRRMANAHPHMSAVFLRSTRYRRFYPARVTHPAPFPHNEVIIQMRRLAG